MLQNQSFENMFLQEELAATQTELFVLESVNTLNEAEEEAKEGKSVGSKAKDFAKAAKEFFIRIAKAIAEAFKKFTAFFVEAFRKLQSRIVNVKKYVNSVQSSAKLEEPKAYTLIAPSALNNLKEIAKPDSDYFNRGFEKAKEAANSEEHQIKGTISTVADASKAAQAADGSVRLIKAAAKTVDQTNKEAQKASKDGVAAAGKGDKTAIDEKKRVATNSSKAHSLARTTVSKAVKLANQTLGTAYVAAKELNSSQKSSDRTAKKEEKKANK